MTIKSRAISFAFGVMLGLLYLFMYKTAFGDTINFAWDAPIADPNYGTPTGYRLYMSRTAGQYVYGQLNAVYDGPASSLGGSVTTTLNPGDVRYFVATAYNNVGESGPSNEVSYVSQAPPVVCTSFVYSAWGPCQPNGTQTRTVVSATPVGCTGGNPILSQSCTYVPPTCVYTYSAWGACQPNGTQTRTVISSTPTGCTGTPILSQSCTYIPPTAQAIRVNCGGLSLTDSQGRVWEADRGFNTGSTYSGGNANIYQSVRWDEPPAPELVYSFNVPNGAYQVTLHFMDDYEVTAVPGGRVFDVLINGEVVLSNFDIFIRVGINTPLVQIFTTNVTNGVLNISFAHKVENPAIRGIEITPLTGPITPVKPSLSIKGVQ